MQYVLNILLNTTKTKVLMQLKDRTVYAGKWNFPGGKIEAGETEHEAALRELLEETGVTPDMVPGFTRLGKMTLDHDCRIGHESERCTLSFYAAAINETAPSQQPGETEELRWIPVRDLDDMYRDGTLAGDGELQRFLASAIAAV